MSVEFKFRVTGFLTMKVGKVVAFAVGGGIIILQVAAHQGYVKINWDKLQKKADKITDKVEEKITGEGPKFMDKVILTIFTISISTVATNKNKQDVRKKNREFSPLINFCQLRLANTTAALVCRFLGQNIIVNV